MHVSNRNHSVAIRRPAHPSFAVGRLRLFTLLLFVFARASTGTLSAQDSIQEQVPSRPLLLAHYMPWYTAKSEHSDWGWHWTMNHFDPDKVSAGSELPELASHYHPLIGPYDSGDAAVLECQLLQMKLAGIDGVIVDWYGLNDFRDYASLHRNTTQLAAQAARLGMKFVICYEDQTVPALVDAGKVSADDRVKHVASEIRWMAKHWFSKSSYVRFQEKPLVLSFGQTGLTDEEWSKCLDLLNHSIAYVSQHKRRSAAVGAFDWPIPLDGIAACKRFRSASADWELAIPVAFPRFVDIYEEANVHKSWGRVDDRDGKTFRETLQVALLGKPFIVQIATWNDWGEGTNIEPSHEFGYRDLEHLQRIRRDRFQQDFAARESDLRLPGQILALRRSGRVATEEVDLLVRRLAQGDLEAARAQSRKLNGPRQGSPEIQ